MQIAHPFRLDSRGRIATSDDDAHVRELIEQVLFTTPGERVNRPNFGSGLYQAVFAPNSGELVSTLQFLVKSALQQWLSGIVEIDDVTVQSDEAAVTVTVAYVVLRNQDRKVAQFTRKV
jgi:phage baseplate assembly protein W